MYAIGSDLRVFGQVLNQVQTIVSGQPNHSNPDFGTIVKPFHIIVLPNVFQCHSVILEDEGLAGQVQLHRFNWDFLWLDTNVLSLEIPTLFREVFINQDTSLLGSIAQSLRIFHLVFKKPSLILAYGNQSELIMSMLDRLEKTSSVRTESTGSDSEFGAMLIIDRSQDYPSCLLTPVVYSGLLLDVFPAKAGSLTIDVEHSRIKAHQPSYLQVKPNKENASVSHHRLNGSEDGIYRDNRFKHFSEVVGLLGAQAKLIGMERENLKDMQLREMQQYVAERLPQLTNQKKELFKHLMMCETIVNELGGKFESIQSLEESMLLNDSKKQTFDRILEQLAVDPHKLNALRHICLMHSTCGISQEEATTFVQQYLNTFGHCHLTVFIRLATAKLFPDIELTQKITQKLAALNLLKQSRFQAESAKLKLIPDANKPNVSRVSTNKEPTCPSYVFNGSYIPLAAQLLSIVLKAERFEEFANKVTHLDQLRVWKYLCRSDCRASDVAAAIRTSSLVDLLPMKRKSVFVYVVGGVTYAEIAACNLVGRMTGTTVVMASDCVATSGDFMEAAIN